MLDHRDVLQCVLNYLPLVQFYVESLPTHTDICMHYTGRMLGTSIDSHLSGCPLVMDVEDMHHHLQFGRDLLMRHHFLAFMRRG